MICTGGAIGGSIAKPFAVARLHRLRHGRQADKLVPLLQTVRAAGGETHGFGSHARRKGEAIALVERIEREIGPLEVLVFNIGANGAVQRAPQDRTQVFHGTSI